MRAYVSGNYAYIADGSKGVVILNIFDPSYPREFGKLDSDGYALIKNLIKKLGLENENMV